MSKASEETSTEEVISLLYQALVHVCGGGIAAHQNHVDNSNSAGVGVVKEQVEQVDDNNQGNSRDTSSYPSSNARGQVKENNCYYNGHDNGNDNGDGDGTSTTSHDSLLYDRSISLWRENLKSFVLKSISFPNGSNKKVANKGNNNNNNNNNEDDSIGKCHDIEIRVATSLFNRYCTSLDFDQCSDKKKKKARKKQNKKRRLNGANLEIISDLGLVRTIYSPHDLASLLVKDMEDQLWQRRTTNEMNNDQCTSNDSSNTSVMMIQTDQSGIICIVTKDRFQYLRENDRHPCSHCIKWCKGQKGLWWHEQMFHGLDHSAATVVASSLASPLSNSNALVIYRKDIGTRTDVVKTDEEEFPQLDKTLGAKKQNEQDTFFDLIKIGNLKGFVDLIQQHHNKNDKNDCGLKYDPKSYLDKNGASALHWAAGCGHVNIVKYLINEWNCPPDQKQKGKRSFHGRTPLHWSARNGHLDVVEYLLENCHEIDIDARTIDGTTAFCWASWQGHLHVMK